MLQSLECCGNTFCTSMVPGSGKPNADIMILGESPGPEEQEQGKPFVGKAGRFLKQKILPGVGLREDQCYLQNSVRCFPGRNKNGKIRNPSAEHIRKCRPNLIQEVARVRPKVIIAMGNAALHACLELARWRDDEKKKDTKVAGITRWRGKRVWHSEFNCWVVFTFHPSYLMRLYKIQKFEFNQTLDDFELAISVSNKTSDFKKPEGLALLGNVQVAADYLSKIYEGDFTEVAVDTETTTLDYREVKKFKSKALLGISISTEPEAIPVAGHDVYAAYIPRDVLLSEIVGSLFQLILVKRGLMKLWHNVAFDERICRYVGFSFGGFEDYNHVCTMLAAKMLDENFSVRLKDLSWLYSAHGGYEKPLDDFRRENKATSFASVPTKKLSKYAAMDAYITHWLWRIVFKHRLENESLLKLFLNTVSKVRMIFTEFEIYGLRADMPRAKALSRKCQKIRAALEARLYKLAGREFKLTSYQQIGQILYGELGVKVETKTKTGRPSTNVDTMKSLLKKRIPNKARVFIQTHLDIAYINKQLSTYIDKLEKVVWDDGRVHTRFNLTGTVTGRPTSSDPNLANTPKDGLIRSLYIPEDGKVFLECDMGAAELRVLAQYCKEPTMIQAFKTGGDLHEETARALFRLSSSEKPSKLQRDKGKRTNFGTVYGISYKELSNKLGVTEEVAKEFLELFFKRYPQVRRWLDGNEAFGKKHGYVISFFNRKRRIPALKSDSFRDQKRAIRQANNAVIQSCASDLCYKAMIRAYYLFKQANLEARMVHSVYDSILIELPESEIPLAKQILTKSFETPIKGLPDFMMKVDFNIADRWGKDHPSKLAEVLQMKPWSDRTTEA